MTALFEGSDETGGEFVRRYDLAEVDWTDQWDRIYIDPADKEKIVNYGLLEQRLGGEKLGGMTLSRHGAVLLSGPPGTGKTTLARGAAHELAKRLDLDVLGVEDAVFKQVEMRHLFSKSHGDSPKLVKRVFDGIVEEAEQGDVFQVVLLDEVESLFANRGMLTETDPMDAIRAVNMALDSLDELAETDNVYVISTSNQPGAVDSAFVDRTDEQIYVGNPRPEHRRRILEDVIDHLARAFEARLSPTEEEMETLVDLCEGFSGRRIRKTFLSALARDGETVRDPGALTVGQVREELEAKRGALEASQDGYIRLGEASGQPQGDRRREGTPAPQDPSE